MAAELGKAWVEIVPSAQNLPGQLKNMFEGPSDEVGKSAGGKLMGSLKKAVAAAGIGAAIKKSLDFGAELQQNLGGTEAVFGDYANKIQATAKSAYKEMGMSASEYMATANKMGSLFQGSGVEQTRALELTQAAMKRAADTASVMGVDTAAAMEAITGAAKGNFTMMDNLGVKMDATTLQAYALEKGINFDWNTASNAEKAEIAMKMFMDRTKNYANNFAEESEKTLSGSIGAMKAAAQDLMGNLVLGENVGPAMNNLVESAVTAAGNLIPAIGNILAGLPGAISTAVNAIHPALMEGLSTATEAVKANFPAMLEGALTSLLSFSSTIRENAGQLVDAGLALIKSIADGIVQNIPVFIQTVPTIISNFAGVINDNAPKILATGLNIIKNLGLGLIQAIPVLVANIPQILKAIWDVFMAFQWLNLGKKVIEFVGKGIKGAASGISGSIKSLTGKIKSTFTGGLGQLKGNVSKLFDGVKTAMTSKITAAKETISGIAKKITGIFPLSVGRIFSNLKIPRINISGGTAPFGIGGLGTKPSISVTWNKKAMENPYLFSNATLFGAGEAGDEMLYGRNRLMKDISEAVKNGGGGDVVINLNYDSSDEAKDMLRDLARGVKRYRMAGAI